MKPRDEEYFRKRYRLISFLCDSEQMPDEIGLHERRLAIGLLDGSIKARMVLPHHTLIQKIKGAWRAAKSDWMRRQRVSATLF